MAIDLTQRTLSDNEDFIDMRNLPPCPFCKGTEFTITYVG